jgi:hypothetical protein
MLNCGISQQLNKIRAHRQYFSEKQQRGYKTCHMVKQLLHAASGNFNRRQIVYENLIGARNHDFLNNYD